MPEQVLEFDLRAGNCGLLVTSPTAVLDDGAVRRSEGTHRGSAY